MTENSIPALNNQQISLFDHFVQGIKINVYDDFFWAPGTFFRKILSNTSNESYVAGEYDYVNKIWI